MTTSWANVRCKHSRAGKQLLKALDAEYGNTFVKIDHLRAMLAWQG